MFASCRKTFLRSIYLSSEKYRFMITEFIVTPCFLSERGLVTQNIGREVDFLIHYTELFSDVEPVSFNC
jgi:hypothetical protein